MLKKQSSDAEPKTITVILTAKDADKNPDLSKALKIVNSGADSVIVLPDRKEQGKAFQLPADDAIRLIAEFPFLYKEVKAKGK